MRAVRRHGSTHAPGQLLNLRQVWHRHGEARQVTVTKPAATGRALRDTWDLPVSEASQAVLTEYIEVLRMALPFRPLA